MDDFHGNLKHKLSESLEKKNLMQAGRSSEHPCVFLAMYIITNPMKIDVYALRIRLQYSGFLLLPWALREVSNDATSCIASKGANMESRLQAESTESGKLFWNPWTPS